MDAATAGLDAPLAALSVPALAWNAHDMLRRAAGTPIRVASKSVRVRGVLDAVLALPGFAGVLAYTLAEGLWLAQTIPDVVVGYPSADRSAIARLAADPELAQRVTVMVDSVEQLDLIDSVVAPGARERIRVCLELDASLRAPLLGHVGVRRSPVHSVAQARGLAEAIVARPGFALVGIMAYEAQVAGVANRPPGRHWLYRRMLDAVQARSLLELLERRSAVVSAVRELAELEFVNGGGTGSLEDTAADPAITEIAAGSGLFGPTLFDGYSRFSPAPAAGFALAAVRRPAPRMVTVHGGGWIASGPPGADRVPTPVWPPGLRMLPREGAGEVQTPLVGPEADDLRLGDRVWFRHAKAGELSEHANELVLVDGDRVAGSLPTYRGEGKAFL